MRTLFLFILLMCMSAFSQIDKEKAAELGLRDLVEIDSIPDKYVGWIAIKSLYDIKSPRDTTVFVYPEGRRAGYLYRKRMLLDGYTYIPISIYKGTSKFKFKEEWKEQTVYIFKTPDALITIQDTLEEYQYFSSFVIRVIDLKYNRYRKMLTRRI